MLSQLSARILCSLICILLFLSCNPGGDSIARICPDFNDYTAVDEMTIGTALKNYILKDRVRYSVLDESQYAYAYKQIREVCLAPIVQTRQIERRNDFPWKVYILNDDYQKHLFVLPGGYLFITTGLLKFLQGYHELMLILAHELTYIDRKVTLMHLVRQFDKCDLGDVLLGTAKDAELQKMAAFLNNLHYAREEVLNADSIAIDLMCQFKFDLYGLRNVIDRAEEQPYGLDWVDFKNCDPQLRAELILENIETTTNCPGGDIRQEQLYRRLIEEYLP